MHTSRTRVSISALVWLEAKAGVEVKSMIDLALIKKESAKCTDKRVVWSDVTKKVNE